jgi:ferritin
MLTDTMGKALNEQVNAEFYSAYLYLSMSAYFRGISLNGFARWMEVQALEEQTHAMKFYSFMNERRASVILEAVEKPPTSWDSSLAVFEDVYRHERKVTGMIHSLVNLAIEERDHATNNFLQWFVSEQVEEEASADEVLQRLKLVRENQGALFLLDRELGQRMFTIPPGTTIVSGTASKTA